MPANHHRERATFLVEEHVVSVEGRRTFEPSPEGSESVAVQLTDEELLSGLRSILPDLVGAVQSGWVSFSHLVDAYRGKEGLDKDAHHQAEHAAIYPLVRKTFVATRGELADMYISKKVYAFAARTWSETKKKKPEFFFLYDLGNAPGATDIFSRIDQLSYDACRLLVDRNALERCQNELYSSATNLIGILEEQSEHPDMPLDKDKVAVVQRDLDELERRYLQTQARLDYSSGVVLGAFSATAALLVLGPIGGLTSVSIVAAALASIGGMLSVVQRMADDTLAIKYDVGRRYLRMLGIARPVIGSFAGVLLLLAIHAKLIPLTLDGGAGVAYLLVAGFAVGWAERSIPDIFTRAGFTNGLPPAPGSQPPGGGAT